MNHSIFAKHLSKNRYLKTIYVTDSVYKLSYQWFPKPILTKLNVVCNNGFQIKTCQLLYLAFTSQSHQFHEYFFVYRNESS